jgi:hypothetical protein
LDAHLVSAGHPRAQIYLESAEKLAAENKGVRLAACRKKVSSQASQFKLNNISAVSIAPSARKASSRRRRSRVKIVNSRSPIQRWSVFASRTTQTLRPHRSQNERISPPVVDPGARSQRTCCASANSTATPRGAVSVRFLAARGNSMFCAGKRFQCRFRGVPKCPTMRQEGVVTP